MDIYIGLDIGETKITAAAAGADLRVLRRERAATPPGLDEGIELAHALVGRVAGDDTVIGMGAAVGGPLDRLRGVVSPLHQPQWRGVPLRRIMERRWGCPFHVDVDTNAAALGEYLFGTGCESSLLYVTVSTGCGGGLVRDGNVFRGANGVHPEVGHQSIAYRCRYPERVRCECGSPGGCLEALVSGRAIERIYGKSADRLDDDEWEEVGYNLGQGFLNMAVMLAPDVIVAGGGVCIGAGEKLLGPARKALTESLTIIPPPAVRLSSLGSDTALTGALAMAKQGAA
jgi:predicted NBD/HSP70 family sugar kinase